MRRRREELCFPIKDRVVRLPQQCSSLGHDSVKAAKQSKWNSSVTLPTLKRKGGLKPSLPRMPKGRQPRVLSEEESGRRSENDSPLNRCTGWMACR